MDPLALITPVPAGGLKNQDAEFLHTAKENAAETAGS